VLSVEEEAAIVAFRRHTLLPLDVAFTHSQATIPHLTRSSLHRCLPRHSIFRLPEIEGDTPKRSTFKRHPIGSSHSDLAEAQTAEGKLRLFIAIDRTSKFAFVILRREAGKMIAARFLRNLIEVVPYAIHTVLTDNGVQFTNQARHQYAFHIFDRVCDENGIEHRLTKVKHPWTNCQVERKSEQTHVDAPWSIQEAAGMKRAPAAAPFAIAWRPGGWQLAALYHATGYLFVLMHQDTFWTHKQPGTEIREIDIASHKLIRRTKLAKPSGMVGVTQDADPLLFTNGPRDDFFIWNATTGKLLHTMPYLGDDLYFTVAAGD